MRRRRRRNLTVLSGPVLSRALPLSSPEREPPFGGENKKNDGGRMRSQSQKEEQEGKKKAAGSEMTARLQYWMEWRRVGGGGGWG